MTGKVPVPGPEELPDLTNIPNPYETGCRTRIKRVDTFLGGYNGMAQWLAPRNLGEPCDLGDSGYNNNSRILGGGVRTGIDNSDNRKNNWGFNRLGVKEYCESQGYNFDGTMPKEKLKAYEWCCKYGDIIGVDFTIKKGTLSMKVNKNK